MKLSSTARTDSAYRLRERGSATILVLALLGIMFVCFQSNQVTLNSLKRELRLVEERQLKKFEAPPKPALP